MNMLSDAKLCALAQSGDSQASDVLMHRHGDIAGAIAHEYFAHGHDYDDFRQEAFIGLHAAVVGFRPGNASFRTFAALCVRRQVITFLKTMRRFKHRVLDESVRVATSEQGEVIAISDLLPSTLCRDPHLVYVEKERLLAVLERMRTLSPLERRSVMGLANGFTYMQISEALGGASHKQIDNATQRARLKLRDAA